MAPFFVLQSGGRFLAAFRQTCNSCAIARPVPSSFELVHAAAFFLDGGAAVACGSALDAAGPERQTIDACFPPHLQPGIYRTVKPL